MKFSKSGVTGIAAASIVAVVAALVPAQAAPQPTHRQSSPTAAQAAASHVSQASQVGQARQAKGELTSNVRGAFRKSGVVRGTFEPKRFVFRRGEVYAVGTLEASLRRGNGTLIGQVDRQISIPVRNARTPSMVAGGGQSVMRTCDILRLVLGPLDLDLLGLQVHLNRVVLNIVAVSGPGNLLGNLLCAVAGLLDRTSLLSQLRLANVLDRILSILRV